MYYLYNLLVPVVFTIVYVSYISGVESLLRYGFSNLMVFLTPYLIWAVVSVYLNISKATIVGGFLGISISLFTVSYIVLSAGTPESGNGWFLYLIFFPLAIFLGAVLGGVISRKFN